MNRTSSVSAALFLGLSLAGCSHSTQIVPPTSISRDTSTVVEATQSTVAPGSVSISRDISTAVQATPSTVAPGSVVHLTLSISNHGSSTVRLGFSDGCQLFYVVYNQEGTRVSEGPVCFQMPTSLTLEAGETRHQPSSWKAVGFDPSGYYQLPRGEYQIQAYLKGYGYESELVTVRVE